MKPGKNQQKECKQSRVLQKKIDRQQEALKEAYDIIFNDVNQDLSLAKINLAMTDIKQPDVAEKKINASHEIVGKAIVDLRQLGNHLNEVMNEEEKVHKEDYEN